MKIEGMKKKQQKTKKKKFGDRFVWKDQKKATDKSNNNWMQKETKLFWSKIWERKVLNRKIEWINKRI